MTKKSPPKSSNERPERMAQMAQIEAVIEEIRVTRSQRSRTTTDELRKWRDEGRRFR